MIIFHEGLPRSGKSYEAVVKHIIPALQAGRPVQAYIEGLNFEKISECADLPLERVQELLTQITRDQVTLVSDWAQKNSLVVIDEAQNFWPGGKDKLPPHLVQWIAEHGHLGIDVILLGQDMSNVHKMWRSRVQTKIIFSKLSAVGQEDRYKFRVMAADAPERFSEVTVGYGKYDKKYFGTYASHVDGTIQTGNYKDKRAVAWNAPGIKYGIPFAVLFIAFAFYRIAVFFTPPEAATASQAAPQPAHVATPAPAPQNAPTAPQSAPAYSPPPPPPPPEKLDLIQEASKKWRPRLSGWMRRADGALYVLVEWYDSGFHLQERMTGPQLASLGWSVDVADDVATLRKGDATLYATTWPIDPFGTVADQKQESIRGYGSSPAAGGLAAQSSGPVLASIPRP